MAELWFYHLTQRRLEQVLPVLLERVRQQNWRALVRCGSVARVEDLSRLLWVYRDNSFLPHGSARDGHAERQPIYLTATEECPNQAEMLFLVDQAVTTPEEILKFQRVALIFNSADQEALTAARRLWKAMIEAEMTAVYYAETERGWQKKAEINRP